MAKGSDKQTFEQKVEELESIIDRIEKAEFGLEESVAQRKRAAELLKECRAVVETAQQDLEQLTVEEIASESAQNESKNTGKGRRETERGG
jgi:exodeoxyribonuclease VII small subunit